MAQAPVVVGGTSFIEQNGWLRASSIFTVSDADGDPITMYQFLDATTTADSSYFWVNGTTPPSSFADPITVSAADLANVWLHGGATIGVVDALQVRAFDSPTSASAWATINLTTQAPSSGPNIFRGGPGHDVLSGTPGDDSFFGDDGSDGITGGFGNDTINGNDGFDIATYSGSKGSYTITLAQDTFTVTGPDGSDTLSGVEKLTFGDGSVKLLSSIAHASGNDLTGDGIGDVLWRGDNGSVGLWGLNGTTITGGGFVNGGAAAPLDWNIAGAADFNGDGHGDILWRGDDGRVAEWNMNGTAIVGGGFVNGGAAVTLNWQIAGVGDFDGDHKADILWHGSDGIVGLWQMNGPNIVGGGFVNGGVSLPPDWHIAAVADFSGDGKSDILWQNVDGRVAEWSLNGTSIIGGGFVNNSIPIVTPDWHLAGVGDFNGDHKSDLLWQNTDGRLGLWQMDGPNIVGGGFVSGGSPVTTGWRIVGVGDFSGDGKSDILLRANDGHIGEWTMNGTTITGGGFVNNGTPVTADWIAT